MRLSGPDNEPGDNVISPPFFPYTSSPAARIDDAKTFNKKTTSLLVSIAVLSILYTDVLIDKIIQVASRSNFLSSQFLLKNETETTFCRRLLLC
uniref:Uncharacterized protein n=1 Tax=Anguilla anguilla TaxID=7936 RepID=A0A0E9XQT1_ANGAN